MAVKNILPSLQAEEKSAQLHVRALPMPSMFGNAGPLLSDAGNNIQGLGAKLALAFKAEHDRQTEQANRIKQNSDRLRLNETINAYRNFVTTRLDEYSKLTGAEAVNSSNKFTEDIAKQRGIISKSLTQTQLREFNLEATQIDFAARRNILNHEEKNIREADIQSSQLSIQNISANYARTGDPENMPQLYRAIEGLYRATYGDVPADDTRITALLTTKDALEREGGKEEEVAKIDKELENFGLRTKAFYDMRDAIVEQMFSARFDYLEEQNKLSEARRFYNEHEDRLSEPTKNRMLKILDDTEKREISKSLASYNVDKVVSAGGADIMYWTPEMEAAGAKLIEDLQKKAIDNPNYSDVLKITQTLLADRERAGKARYASDLYSRTKDLGFNLNDIHGLERDISKLQDEINKTSSPSLKRGLEEILAKYQQHHDTVLKNMSSAGAKDAKELLEKLENDPIHKRAVTMFMVGAATNENDFVVSWGKGRYNLKTKEGLEDFRKATIATLDINGNWHGFFTPKEFEKFAEMVNNPSKPYVSSAAQDLLEVINRNSGSERKITEAQLIAYAPELIDQVLKWRALLAQDGNLTPSNFSKQDKEMLEAIATQNTLIEDKYLWIWDSNKTLASRIASFFAGLKEGEIDLDKIRKHKATYELNEQDEVRGELNKKMLSVSSLPDAKDLFYNVAAEGLVNLMPEGYDPTGQGAVDAGTNVWKMVKVENDEEKAAREAAEKAAAEKAEARRKRMEAPVVVSTGATPNNTYGFNPR